MSNTKPFRAIIVPQDISAPVREVVLNSDFNQRLRDIHGLINGYAERISGTAGLSRLAGNSRDIITMLVDEDFYWDPKKTINLRACLLYPGTIHGDALLVTEARVSDGFNFISMPDWITADYVMAKLSDLAKKYVE